MGHKSILTESAYPDSGLEFSKYMNGKISRAEIICFLPGFLCKFAEYFTGVYTVRLYDPVFYKDNFENAGAEKQKRI